MLRCDVSTNVDWARLDSLPDRTIFQTRPWLEFVSEAQAADPIVIALYEDDALIAYCTGAITHKFGLKLFGSPFPGWTTSYLGFNLLRPYSRIALARAVFDFAFRELGCVHGELMDRNLPIEDAQAAGFTYRTFTNFYGAKGIDWDAVRKRTRSTTGYPEYEVSKLANVLSHRRSSRGASRASRRTPCTPAPSRPMCGVACLRPSRG